MCNEQARRIALGLLRNDFNDLRIPIHFPEGMPNFEPLDSIRITDRNAIVRAAPGGGAELVMRRWSWPGAHGKPVYNFRSEGRRFKTGRCLIVADGFYEFTEAPLDAEGKKPKRKQKWLFTKRTEPWFCIAGLWRADPQVGEAYTMLTTSPGPDILPYHDRQIVVLERADWAEWLDPQASPERLLQPAPAGSFEVRQVV
ncbi:SOS response-associated peptidase [Sphingomonas sp. M1-B02]|uniref:SOS response-associated peptidase n=1 Tax=Sphingomonas sp. M1-B02 TaxID=3114300 RepID=UPI0022406FCE|nr:SOS response-associated peptidase [Sphingomonas sp. S6-11]UZK65378.1 SOS response-associated peptidase [Sphingomonas sp. S6-11]